MRLRPHESRVDQADLLQTLEFPQADSKELPALELSDEPGLGRSEPSITIAAEGQRGLLRDGLGDVDTVAQAVDAAICGIGRNGCAAVCAEYVGLLLGSLRRDVSDSLHHVG